MLAGDTAVDELRIDPSLRLELRPELGLGRGVSLSATITADAMLQRHRFLSGAEEVTAISPIQLGFVVAINAAVTL
jgi:hypothetical protein